MTAPQDANAPAGRTKYRLDVDFLLLLALLVASHLPVLSPRIQPVNDTVYVFHVFHYFYSEFLINGDLARWLPYGMYGVPATFDQLVCLSPACYAVGLGGAALGVTDALLLLKVALFGEKLLFLIGLYAFGGLAYETRVARVLVCAVGALAVTLPYNLWWDWRVFYLLPLMLYFLARFFRQRSAACFWLTGLTAVAAMFGSLIYFGPFYLLVLSAVTAVLTVERPRAWAALLRPSRGNLLGLLAFAPAAAVYCWQALHCLDDVAVTAVGRRPGGAAVPLDNFLDHGLHADAALLTTALTGWPVQSDNAHYIGLLPLLGAGWALFKVRAPLFWAVVTAALVLVLLSMRGTTARAVYHFPTVSLFRHIGLTYGAVKVLALIAGGFGLDRFVRTLAARGPAPVPPWYCVPALVLLAGVPLDLWVGGGAPELRESWVQDRMTAADYNSLAVAGRAALHAGLAVLLVALFRTGAVRRPGGRAAAVLGVSAVLLVDVGSYRYVTQRALPRLHRDEPGHVPHVRPVTFCPSRGDAPDFATALEMDRYAHPREGMKHPDYAVAYNFFGYDPALSQYRADQLARRTLDLLGARGWSPEDWRDHRFDPSGDAWLRRAMAMQSGKLRLTNDVVAAGGRAAALDAIRALPLTGETVVLELSEPGTPPPGGPPATGGYEVVGFSANTLAVKTRVTNDGGAWLYYADGNLPDWACTVNGRPAAVVGANAAFKAVHVPSGDAVVRFSLEGQARTGVCRAQAALGVALFSCGLGFGLALLARPARAARTDPRGGRDSSGEFCRTLFPFRPPSGYN